MMSIKEAKVYRAVMYVPTLVNDWLCQYPKITHALLLAWIAFMTSWAAHASVPVDFTSIGLPFIHFNINADACVVWMQAKVHLPSWCVGGVTALVSWLVAFGNYRLTHPMQTLNGQQGSPANQKYVAAAFALALLTVGGLSGCQPATSTTPVNATAPNIYQQGAQAMDDFSKDLVSAQNIEINLHKGGVVPDATHVQIQATFKSIAGYGQQIDALIRAQASAATITAKINAALGSLATIATQAAGLDANTAAQVSSSVAALQGLLNGLLPIFNVSAVGRPVQPAGGPQSMLVMNLFDERKLKPWTL